ncbi:MAG: hypothetical protein LBJ73_05290 [Rickettsiales bacterium]|jgi:hypothetical protein|nr:hypothetical protein [Rickettsiales bacterium]
MNIFIMVLVFLFMAGYYLMDSPSQRVVHTELEHAITRTDLRSIAECAAAAHTAAIRGYEFQDICVEQYRIATEFICLNERQAVTKCEIVRKKKPAFSFVVTSTAPIDPQDYNGLLELLEEYFPNSGAFGIYTDDVVLGGTGKRDVPQSVSKSLELTDGQLVYLTQYEMPDEETEYIAPNAIDINCPSGTVKVYRFSRWQCALKNEKASCASDEIWNFDTQKCVPDNSRKPLCAARQTAVMVDDIWECVDPFNERDCPAGWVARLNYNNLEWECVEDSNIVRNTKKCLMPAGAIYGGFGATLRISPLACNDCETMVTDSETCEVSCVPNPGKLNDTKCYPGHAAECSGSSRAFYFGFPNAVYASKVPDVAKHAVPFDAQHSQNRRFNCLDCGEGSIDTDKSLPPYIAICK